LLASILGSMHQTAEKTVLGQQIYVKYASLIKTLILTKLESLKQQQWW